MIRIPEVLEEGGARGVAPAVLPLLSVWAYDFAANRLLLDETGAPYLVHGNEALKVWIYWTLLNERFRYAVNSAQYGTELYTALGYPLSNAAKRDEIRRFVVEALMVCPYIIAVEQVDIAMDGQTLRLDIRVESVYKDEGWVETVVYV